MDLVRLEEMLKDGDVKLYPKYGGYESIERGSHIVIHGRLDDEHYDCTFDIKAKQGRDKIMFVTVMDFYDLAEPVHSLF